MRPSSTGDALTFPTHADKTIQVYGTFGSGTLTLEGANHPTSPTWAALTNQGDNTIALTAAGIELVSQNPYQIRPNLTGSTDATITVIIVVRG